MSCPILERKRIEVAVKLFDAFFVGGDGGVDEVEAFGEFLLHLGTTNCRFRFAQSSVSQLHTLIFKDDLLATMTDHFFGVLRDVGAKVIRIVGHDLIAEVPDGDFLSHAVELGTGGGFDQRALMGHHFFTDGFIAEPNFVSGGDVILDDVGKAQEW